MTFNMTYFVAKGVIICLQTSSHYLISIPSFSILCTWVLKKSIFYGFLHTAWQEVLCVSSQMLCGWRLKSNLEILHFSCTGFLGTVLLLCPYRSVDLNNTLNSFLEILSKLYVLLLKTDHRKSRPLPLIFTYNHLEKIPLKALRDFKS